MPTRCCVFCLNEFSSKGIGEHVIPEAMGGVILLKDVCPSCNNDLNNRIDNVFCSDFLNQVKRYTLGLADKRGKVARQPFQQVVQADSGTNVRLDDNFVPRVIPRVELKEINEGFELSVSVDRSLEDKLEQIVFNKIERFVREREGGVASRKQRLIAQRITQDVLDTTKKSYKKEHPGQLHFQQLIDLKVHLLEYVKIAYEMWCMHNGEDFIYGDDGNFFRDILQKGDVDNISGQLGFPGLDFLNFDSNKHYVIVSEWTCYIRLLDLPCLIARPGFVMNGSSIDEGAIYINDPVTKRVESKEFVEFIKEFTQEHNK